MHRLALPTLALVALAVAGCGRGPLREYVSADGRFSVLLYPNARADGTVVGNQFSDGAISVVYREQPLPADAEALEELLDELCERALKNVTAQSLTANILSLDGEHPGRMIEADLLEDRGEYRAKLVLAHGRCYLVQAIGTASFVQSEAVEEFLQSFEIRR